MDVQTTAQAAQASPLSFVLGALALLYAIGKGLELYLKLRELGRVRADRLPLKRANDEHIERMAGSMRDLSAQQERTARAVDKLGDGIDGVRTDVGAMQADINVLLDRGSRGGRTT